MCSPTLFGNELVGKWFGAPPLACSLKGQEVCINSRDLQRVPQGQGLIYFRAAQ